MIIVPKIEISNTTHAFLATKAVGGGRSWVADGAHRSKAGPSNRPGMTFVWFADDTLARLREHQIEGESYDDTLVRMFSDVQ